LPLDAQVKLLRGLENKTIEKLGSPEPIKMDFRLIAATNRDLKGMIKHGQFREELFYRLNAMTVYIPKLSERKEDIPVLVAHYLKILGKPDILCTNNAMDTLKRYPWPGNARELRNVIEHTVSLLDGNVIDVKDLPPEIVLLHYNIQIPRDRSDKSLAGMLAQCESQLIKESLRVNKGNMVKTARHLGISRTALYRKCKKHNLNEYEWLENCNC
jgi:DNA-binding NtrC family response regulator